MTAWKSLIFNYLFVSVACCITYSHESHATEDLQRPAPSFCPPWADVCHSTGDDALEIKVIGKAKSEEKARLKKEAGVTLQLLNEHLPKELTLPQKLRVVLNADGTRDTYDAPTTTVHINAAVVASELRHTLLHEVGHAIMEDSMDRLLPTALTEKHQKYASLNKEKAAVLKPLLQLHSGHGLSLFQDHQKLREKYGEVLEQLKFVSDFADVAKPFHEFFADSVSVIATGEPNGNVSTPANPEKVLNRDFSLGYNEENIATWKKNLNPSKMWDSYQHFVFTPARWATWDLIKDRLTTKEEKQKLLFAIHKATVTEMAAVMTELNETYQTRLKSNPDTQFRDVLLSVDIPELNERLIISIKSQLLR